MLAQYSTQHRLGPVMYFRINSIGIIRQLQTAAVILLLTIPVAQLSAEQDHHNHSMMHQQHRQKNRVDLRTPLNLPPQMAQHQLSNMRGHLEAVQKIVSLVAKSNFEDASDIAWQQLGSRPEMLKMCNQIDNEDFKQRGLRFHESGDALAKALKTKDTGRSLDALNNTLQHCTSCHATYKQ